MPKYKVEFIETKKCNLTGYTLIDGFPGMGLVGTIAAKYLIEKLDFKEIGYIMSDAFAPIVRIHNGLPINPARIYYNQKFKIVLMMTEQVIPQEMARNLAGRAIEFVRTKKIKRVISLAGINNPNNQIKEDIVFGIAANEKSKASLKKANIELIKEGISTGATAIMLLGLSEENIECYSLLGNAKIQADYRAAAQVVTKLNEIMSLNINVKPLLEEAKETEKVLMKQLDEMKKTQEVMDSNQPNEVKGMYS